MDDKIKGRVVMILSVVALIFFILWLGALVRIIPPKEACRDKAALSMELEEKNAKLEKEKADLSGGAKKVPQTQLSGEKAAHEITKKSYPRSRLPRMP